MWHVGSANTVPYQPGPLPLSKVKRVTARHTHTHTHTHFLGLRRWRRTAQGHRSGEASASACRAKERRRTCAVHGRPASGVQRHTGITPKPLLGKCRQKEATLHPGSGEARRREREARRQGRTRQSPKLHGAQGAKQKKAQCGGRRRADQGSAQAGPGKGQSHPPTERPALSVVGHSVGGCD